MKLWFCLLSLPLLVPTGLVAQGGAPPPRLLLQALDTDGDGQLSPAEIEASASLLKLDRNHDGQLTADEYSPKIEDKAASSELMTRLMAMDRNGDGVLTRDEVPERMHSMFDRGDTNHDSKLGADEIKAMAAAQADPQGRPVARGKANSMDPLMDALDVDHDGVLSAAELASAPGGLKTLDKDADGTLATVELRMRQQTPQQRAAHLFDEWDTNKDGGLIQAELPDRMQPMFATLDLNYDSKIDMEEATTYFATMPQPSQGAGGRPGPPRERMPQTDAPSSPTTLPPARSQQ